MNYLPTFLRSVVSTASRTLPRLLVALALLPGLSATSQAQQSSALGAKVAAGTSGAALLSTAKSKGFVRVIAMFDQPEAPAGARSQAEGLESVKSLVAATRDAILASHFGGARSLTPGKGFERHLTSFPYTAGFAINVSAQELETLAADPRIVSIQQDALSKPYLNESVALIGAPVAHAAGAQGSNQTVVVIDTGIKSTHEFLNGQVIAEACFSNGGGGGLSLCPNGLTSQTGAGAADANTTNCNNAPAGANAFNLCNHGTHVAGIAAGFNSGFASPKPPIGVAKWSRIFAIQVFTRFNDAGSCGAAGPPCVLAYTSDQINALNHVLANQAPGGIPVASVNMSLGGGAFSSTCDADSRKPIIDSLRSAGIVTVIASGNDGFTSQIGAPGCISTAFTVGSTSKTDVISSFSNMSSVVDVLAPGGDSNGGCTFTGSTFIVGPVVTNGGSIVDYGCLIGTSMAAPHVAGAIAVLKSAYPGATAAQIETAFINTGVTVADTRPGGTISKPRIRLERALKQGWWTYGVAGLGDFNGDGRSDILWRHSNGLLVIWFMNGGTRTSSAIPGSLPAEWHVAGIGDFNGDNTSDILWRHSNGTVAIWLMNGASPGALLGGGSIASPPTSWTIAGVGKFYGGANSAILWRNANGGLLLWRMNGLTIQSSTAIGSATIDWSTAGVGDFNGDGTSDILWRNKNNAALVWLMNNGAFASGGSPGAPPTAWTISGVQNVNPNVNANSDIVWRNANGSVSIWFMNGTALGSSAVPGAPATTWNIAGVGSFGGTNADILWRNTSGATLIWHLNTAGGIAGSSNLGVVP